MTRPTWDHLLSELCGGSDDPDAPRLANEIEREVKAMTEWKDISTAPKNGTRVLLWMEPHDDIKAREPEEACAVIGSYVVWSWQMKQQGMKDGWSWYGPARCKPTHWMPLPAPPHSS